jgi:hypothetical protein
MINNRSGARISFPDGYLYPYKEIDFIISISFGLRKIHRDYFGPCLLVRNYLNEETEIGWDGDYLDVVDLEAFSKGGDVYVKTLYNQNINAELPEQSFRNFVQNTDASQPQIVSNGKVLRNKGVPCIYFDGTNDFLACGRDYCSLRSIQITTLGEFENRATNDFLGTRSSALSGRGSIGLLRSSGSNIRIGYAGIGGYTAEITTAIQNPIILENIVTDTLKQGFYNNIPFTTYTGTAYPIGTSTAFTIGRAGAAATEYYKGKIIEYIGWGFTVSSESEAFNMWQTRENYLYGLYKYLEDFKNKDQ